MKTSFLILPILFLFIQGCMPNRQETPKNPIQLSSAGNKASSLFLTQDEQNRPVISWVELDSTGSKHFNFAYWDQTKQAFGRAIKFPLPDIANTHEEGMPKLAFKGDGTIIATYETTVPSDKSRFGLSDILYVVSSDHGKTWSDPQPIQTQVALGSRSFGSILRLADGEVGISWLDTDPDPKQVGRPVKFARSNAANSFDTAVLLDAAACQCCRTAISADESGHVGVVFRDLLPGSVRDIAISNSSDNGHSFDRAIPFSNDQWVVDGCPHAGPSVVSKAGKTYVTWYTGASSNEGVFYATLENNKMRDKQRLNADARFVQIALTPSGVPLIAYQASYEANAKVYSKLVLAKSTKTGFLEQIISPANAHASYPMLTAIDDEQVLVAWSDQQQIYYRVVSLREVTEPAKATEASSSAGSAEKTLFPELDVTTDPVCGMTVNAETVADTTLAEGKVLGFCSAACKERFR